MAKDWKATTIDWAALESYDDVDIIKVCLTQKQVAILKALLIPQYWSTRWDNQTVDFEDISAYVAALDGKLDGQECDTMTFCEDVANCIEDSDNVSDALTEWNTVNNGNGGVGNPEEVLPESVREADLLPDGFICDNDHRYGMAVGIVEAIHTATIEIFELIEIITNPLELAAEIGDNIPVLAILASAADVITWVQNSAYEGYNLAWSDEVKDFIACEIYCLMLDEFPCRLDYSMLMFVYKDDDFAAPPAITDPLIDWIDWIIAIPFTSAILTVKLCGLLGLLIMRYGGRYGKFILGIRTLQTTMSLLADDTNPDWAILCLECPPRWIHTWNFATHGMDTWYVESDYGEYVEGVGVVAGDRFLDGWYARMIEMLHFPEPIPRCDKQTMHHTTIRGSFTTPSIGYRMQQPPSPEQTWNNGYVTTGSGTKTAAFDLTNVEFGRCTALACFNESGFNGNQIITAMTFEGTGSDPFEERDTGEAP